MLEVPRCVNHVVEDEPRRLGVEGRECKRLSTLGGGVCRILTSGTEGRARVFFFRVLRPLYFYIRISSGVCGRQRVPSACLLSMAALVVRTQPGREGGRTGFFCALPPVYFPIYISPGVWRCKGASVSILSAAALGVCTKTGREGEGAEVFCGVVLPLYFPVYISRGVCARQGVQVAIHFV